MSQFLSDFNTPSINGNVAKRILANEVLRGVAQGTIESNGEGVTQRFSNDVSGAQIRIVQFMPFNQEARELGATLNGSNFDGRTALQASTNGLGVDVITVINQNIDIPQVTSDMLPIDFLGQCMENLTMDINNNINGMTIGGKIVATFNDIANGNADFEEITKATATGDDWRLALMNMYAKLDEGDSANGLAFFPDNDRCIVLRASVIPYLLNKGVFSLGGANHAYEMLAMGGVSPNTKQDVRSGYVGEFENTPVYKVVPLIMNLSAKYAGVPVWAIDDVYGYISSGYANVRAIAQEEQVKIIDSPDGAGVRLQPNFRMGYKSLYAKGNVFLVETGYTNPSSGALILKAPASRTISSDASLTGVSFGGSATAFNDTLGAWYLSVANAVTSGALSNAVATAGTLAKVTYNTGSQNLVTGANNFYVDVVAEDGKKAKVKVLVSRSTQ